MIRRERARGSPGRWGFDSVVSIAYRGEPEERKGRARRNALHSEATVKLQPGTEDRRQPPGFVHFRLLPRNHTSSDSTNQSPQAVPA